MMNRPLRRHELLEEVAEHAANRLHQKHGLDLEAAADVGNDLADWMADHFGGQSVYFVKDEGARLVERDWQIFERMRRGNAHQLAAEYSLSFVRIYQIYKRCLAEARRRVQDDLFPGGAEELAARPTSVAELTGCPQASVDKSADASEGSEHVQSEHVPEESGRRAGGNPGKRRRRAKGASSL